MSTPNHDASAARWAHPHRKHLVATVFAGLAVVGLAVALGGADEASAQVPPYEMAQQQRMDPRAEKILGEMSTKLAAADAFTARARRMTDAEFIPGAVEPEDARVRVSVERPDRLFAEARGEGFDRKMYYDGESFVLVEADRKLYSKASLPGNIDVLVRTLSHDYGFNPPVADLVVADPFAYLTRDVEAGKYLGREQVDGKTIDHLRFDEEYVSWEVWVDRQNKLPVKMVATAMNMPGNPKIVADNIQIDLEPSLRRSQFTFEPSRGMRQIPMVETDQEPAAAR